MKKAQLHTKNTPQKLTEYRPTNAEQKLLEVMLDQQYRMEKVTKMCKLAGIARQTYYDCFNKPEFVAHYKEESHHLVYRSLAQLINTLIYKALRGNATYTKMLLTMTGDYPGKMTFPNCHGNSQSPLKVIMRKLGDDDDGT